MSSAAADPRKSYGAAFGARVERSRKRKRVLRATSIGYKVARADFETTCLAKLTKPESVTFK
jgi:hypothetical protein